MIELKVEALVILAIIFMILGVGVWVIEGFSINLGFYVGYAFGVSAACIAIPVVRSSRVNGLCDKFKKGCQVWKSILN